MNRPAYLRVLGRTYLLQFVPQETIEGNYGVCDHRALVISVAEGLNPIEEMDTVIHELLHAIWHTSGLYADDLEEERCVFRLATCLTAVFLDNPRLLPYLNHLRKQTSK